MAAIAASRAREGKQRHAVIAGVATFPVVAPGPEWGS
jgi:hypothetical protein